MESIIADVDDKLSYRRLTERILACAVDVHRELGPDLLESAYRVCLVHRLRLEGLSVEEEVLKLRVGLLLNFNVTHLDKGIRRFVR